MRGHSTLCILQNREETPAFKLLHTSRSIEAPSTYNYTLFQTSSWSNGDVYLHHSNQLCPMPLLSGELVKNRNFCKQPSLLNNPVGVLVVILAVDPYLMLWPWPCRLRHHR